MKKHEHSASSKIASQRLQNFNSNKDRLTKVTNVTIEEFEAKGKAYNNSLSAYNEQVKGLEDLIKEVKQTEKEYTRYGTLFLTGVLGSYGPDSEEYRLAGGVPFSERNGSKKKSTENGTAN